MGTLDRQMINCIVAQRYSVQPGVKFQIIQGSCVCDATNSFQIYLTDSLLLVVCSCIRPNCWQVVKKCQPNSKKSFRLKSGGTYLVYTCRPAPIRCPNKSTDGPTNRKQSSVTHLTLGITTHHYNNYYTESQREVLLKPFYIVCLTPPSNNSTYVPRRELIHRVLLHCLNLYPLL